MSFKTWLTYKKILWFGDDELERKGSKILPCRSCEAPIKVYLHYGPLRQGIDDLCDECREK